MRTGNDTRDRIRAIEKLIAEFRSVSNISHRQIDSITEHSNADNQQADKEPIRTSIELQLPPAIAEHYNSKREKTQGFYIKWIKPGIDVATLLAVIIYASLTFQQWRAMLDSNAINRVSANAAKTASETAKNALAIQSRPWVAAAKIEVIRPLTFGPNGASINIRFRLKNLGNSPSINVQSRGRIVSLSEKTWHAGELENAERQECSELLEQAKFPGTVGWFPILFPDYEIYQVWPATISQAGIRDGMLRKESGPFEHKGYVSLSLVTCIDYVYSFTAEHHQTAYGFDLGTPMGNGITMQDFKPEGVHPEIKLISNGQYAN